MQLISEYAIIRSDTFNHKQLEITALTVALRPN